MRWYCVHPNLPLHAELRIRAAPDSSAAERARIPQGRSIASCSPVFQVPGDGVDSAPISWLQVAYHDNVSGETETGFMMAALPDGTTLVTPWESTDFYSCCEVTDSAALLYDGPHETARSFGLVQSVNFLYCIVEEAEKRARVFHPELESVWIEKKDLHIVCTRFKHGECSTPHTFFELSGALPEEAQIAIREYPLKEAQTVGLLSRGETVEVTVRGGNWLRIAGGGVDKAWIMWRTDALELLQEAPDVCSSTCERTAENANSLALNKSVAEANPDQIGDSGEVTRITPAVTVGSVQADTANDATPVQNVRSWCDRTCPAQKLIDEEGDSDNDDDVDAAGTKLVPVDQSWDDRPPLAAPGEGIDNDNYGASAMAMEMDDVPVNRCNEDDKTQIQVCTTRIAQTDDINGASTSEPGGVNGGTTRKEVVTLPDERPIHPARYVVEEHVIDERADAASVEVVENGGTFVSGDVKVDDSSKRTEAAAYPDEHPIHPARYVVEEHVIDERADAASVEVVENGGTFVSGDVSTDRDTVRSEVVAAVASPDERPIRPARSVIEEEFNAVSVELVENSDAGADFVRVGDCAAEGVAKAALSARIYGTIGCGGTKAESNSESEAGDIAVLGGLDDVFDPVDELIVDILVKDTEKTVGTCEYAVREENEQSDGDMDNRVTTCSFTLVAQEKPNVEDSDDAALFLQEFGIIKYCKRKQSLNPASDKLSQAMFNADQDDADLVFEVLVGDDPLSDEWFHDVASKSSAATLHSEPREAVLKLSLSVDSGDTYTLIMGDATPEDILESELLDDDDGNYDLVRSFRYPLPTRRHEHSGNGLSPVRSPPSSVLRQHQSASAESSPVSSVKPPMPSTQSVVPPTVSATPSGLAQRKSIGAPSSIAKPPSALVCPRSFVRTPATPSKMSVKPASSRLTQHAPTLSGLSSSKTTKSFLPTPSPQKVANTSARTNTILKPAESSGLPTPRMSFGFRRLPKN
ncbi:hypothetical protein JG688_00015287 [Phytophthora aleatoria]|uniref:Uncharacterized protein n=1 Tax=Phytophthora aleatoria TaxID=2496075 RepID=A0A8J5IEH2_9STRA|nr:hypothetical protein JG688_00015287 [Phytophthora aleatoria]